jgi:hypothetical protein
MLLAKALQFAASQESLISYLRSRKLDVDKVHRTTISAVYKNDVFAGAEIFLDYGLKGPYNNDVYVTLSYKEATAQFAVEAIMVDSGYRSHSIWPR